MLASLFRSSSIRILLLLIGGSVTQSWCDSNISSYSALGDSFAAGDGAGRSDWTPRLDPLCGRFSSAYPILLANKLGLRTEIQSFQYVACGGATTTSVMLFQLAQVRESQLVTITVGGNEVDFIRVLNECVYHWLDSKGCEAQLQATRSAIQSSTLLKNFDRMVKAAIKTLPPSTLLLLTGYPRFFNEHTDQCDHVSFSKSRPDSYLRKEMRRDLNELVEMLNEVIIATCQANSLNYVDLDGIFEGHRFCERGIDEPADTPEIWFFNSPSLPSFAGHAGDPTTVLSSPFRDFLDSTKVFHPTALGHEAISEEILRFVQMLYPTSAAISPSGNSS